MKGIRTRKEGELSLLAGDMITYVGTLPESNTGKATGISIELSSIADYQANYKNLLFFCTPATNNQEQKLKYHLQKHHTTLHTYGQV